MVATIARFCSVTYWHYVLTFGDTKDFSKTPSSHTEYRALGVPTGVALFQFYLCDNFLHIISHETAAVNCSSNQNRKIMLVWETSSLLGARDSRAASHPRNTQHNTHQLLCLPDALEADAYKLDVTKCHTRTHTLKKNSLLYRTTALHTRGKHNMISICGGRCLPHLFGRWPELWFVDRTI